MRLPAILFALTLFVSSLHAADPLPQVFACGTQGVAGGLGTGTELTRYTVDVARFPEAICNDGTPAVFYYAPATKVEDRNKWIIFLQGGGSCVDGQTCAERWCSVNTNYGMDKMSTSLTKPAIRGVGFMNPAPENRFGSWNRVLMFYCSSDTWNGSNVATVQASANGLTREYKIYFKGRHIVEAVLDTLRNASLGRRRAIRHDAVAEASAWPDLDDAEAVMFAGSSGGGAGVRANLDRVAAKLKLTNPDLAIGGVIEAIYAPLSENRDFSKSVYCQKDPARGCSYEAFMRAQRQEVEIALQGAKDDESCLQWHTTNAPGTEWRCSDGEHVNLNHLGTPFFLRQDLLDESIAPQYVEAGFGTLADYAMRVESELRFMQTPEEPHGAMPGLFVPQCTNHESFTDNEAVYDVKINGVNYNEALWNWWTRTQPQQLIRAFTGVVGKAPECP